MPENTLLAYSTTDGHTLHICERIRDRLKEQGQSVTIRSIAAVTPEELSSSDKIVIGASIRYGRHSDEVSRFIQIHHELLSHKPSAFFSVNLVARKPNRNTPETNPYARRFLKRISWKPKLAAVFAGRLDYPSYGFWDRHVIRLIMLITGGPTDPASITEFTDWMQVDAFASGIAGLK